MPPTLPLPYLNPPFPFLPSPPQATYLFGLDFSNMAYFLTRLSCAQVINKFKRSMLYPLLHKPWTRCVCVFTYVVLCTVGHIWLEFAWINLSVVQKINPLFSFPLVLFYHYTL